MTFNLRYGTQVYRHNVDGMRDVRHSSPDDDFEIAEEEAQTDNGEGARRARKKRKERATESDEEAASETNKRIFRKVPISSQIRGGDEEEDLGGPLDIDDPAPEKLTVNNRTPNRSPERSNVNSSVCFTESSFLYFRPHVSVSRGARQENTVKRF